MARAASCTGSRACECWNFSRLWRCEQAAATVDMSRNLQQQALIKQMQASQPAAHWRFSLKLTTRSFACAKQENLLQQHAELKEQLELTQSFLVIPRSLLSRSMCSISASFAAPMLRCCQGPICSVSTGTAVGCAFDAHFCFTIHRQQQQPFPWLRQ